MKKMTESDLHKYRVALEALSSRIRSDATGMVEQARSGSGGNSGSELSNAPLHLGDMGTEEFLYDMNAALLGNEQYIVAEAREALNRMDSGTFGICESCGKPIASRLAAIPYTRFCVKCAATDDQTPQANIDEGRPHSPTDTLAPEGEMQEDGVSRTTRSSFRRRTYIGATFTRRARLGVVRLWVVWRAVTKATATRSAGVDKRPAAAISTSKMIGPTTARPDLAVPAAQVGYAGENGG